jgi:hypothetical protein
VVLDAGKKSLQFISSFLAGVHSELTREQKVKKSRKKKLEKFKKYRKSKKVRKL